MRLNFIPDPGGSGGMFHFKPAVMIDCLRGRIIARKALSEQSVGDVEKLKHEQAIAAYEAEIEQLQGGLS